MTPQDLKKALVAAGFEVYRTVGSDVALADRARENLVMDSGVRVRVPNELGAMEIRLIMGLRRSQHPDHSGALLFERIRELAKSVIEDSFLEIEAGERAVKDPSDAEKTLDTFCEVTFMRIASSIEEAAPSLRLALTVAKTAESRH